VAGDGRHIDDVTAPLFLHDRQRRGDSVEDALHVDVDHAVPVVDLQPLERRERHQPRVVHEDVDPPERFSRASHQSLHVRAPDHIRDHHVRLAARLADVSGEALETVLASRAEGDRSALNGQELRGGFADATARARDDDDFACMRWFPS
jgi:hypothetical protein